MSYLTPADMRQASLADFAFGLALDASEAEDTRLTSAIARMSKRFDDLTNDHYESQSLTLTLDGSGGPTQLLGKRCTAVTSVTTKDYLGNTTVQASTKYRLHSSLNAAGTDWLDPCGLDWLEVVPGQYLTLTGISVPWPVRSYWPSDPQAVIVAGSFGWTAVPAGVKRAVALLVYDQIKPTGAGSLRRATAYASGDASFSLARSDDDDNPTGMPEVDELYRQFRYGYQSAVVG